MSENLRLTAIVVDDEHHARQAVLNALQSFAAVEVVGVCENGLDAVKAVHDKQPQLMFLDIRMPSIDGFDVLDLLGDEAPEVVFVTAHDEYAVKAFDANAVDYLLKPINAERLQMTLQRAADRILRKARKKENQDGDSPKPNTRQLLDERDQQHAPIQRILVRDRGEVTVVPARDVSYIESAGDYVVIHTESENHIKQERLQHLENVLDPSQFCRVHRTSIVNIKRIVRIETDDKGKKVAVMENEERQPISRSGYARLVKLL